MNPESKLTKLQDLLKLVNESISREEFTGSFRKVIDLVIKAESRLASRINQMLTEALREVGRKFQETQQNIEALKSELNTTIDSRLADVDKKINTALTDQQSGMNLIRDKLRVFTPKDGHTPTKKELTSLIKEVLPPFPKDRLELIEENAKLISSLEKRIKELEDRPERVGGGTSAIGVQFAMKTVVKTETPSGAINGINTSYTVSEPIHAIFSFMINGEAIPSSAYTIAGRTITFGTALPSAYSGKDFEVVYA